MPTAPVSAFLIIDDNNLVFECLMPTADPVLIQPPGGYHPWARDFERSTNMDGRIIMGRFARWEASGLFDGSLGPGSSSGYKHSVPTLAFSHFPA